jgi:hypothetical protein
MNPEPDDYLVGRIQEALARDPRTHKQDVRVAIVAGAIRLSGQTTTEERRSTIESLVYEMCPDRKVYNELAVIEVDGPGEPEIIRHD